MVAGDDRASGRLLYPPCNVSVAGARAHLVEFEIDHLAQAVWDHGGVDEPLDECGQAPSICH